MAWQDVMVTMLRALVNDMDATKYQDDTLEQMLVVAAFQVKCDLPEFEFRADISNTNIVPDPTVGDSPNDSFVNLACIKAACIIDRGSAALAASQAIAVKDGSSSIDLRGALTGKLALLEKGWCSVFNDAKFNYQRESLEAAGSAIMSPFRIYASEYFGGISERYWVR